MSKRIKATVCNERRANAVIRRKLMAIKRTTKRIVVLLFMDLIRSGNFSI